MTDTKNAVEDVKTRADALWSWLFSRGAVGEISTDKTRSRKITAHTDTIALDEKALQHLIKSGRVSQFESTVKVERA